MLRVPLIFFLQLFPVFLGKAIFSFKGVTFGLVLSIQDMLDCQTSLNIKAQLKKKQQPQKSPDVYVSIILKIPHYLPTH